MQSRFASFAAFCSNLLCVLLPPCGYVLRADENSRTFRVEIPFDRIFPAHENDRAARTLESLSSRVLESHSGV
jgi:hypothetical protein